MVSCFGDPAAEMGSHSSLPDEGLSLDMAYVQSLGGTDHPCCRSCVAVVLIHWVFSSSKSHCKNTERSQHWKHEFHMRPPKHKISPIRQRALHTQARSNLLHRGDDKHPTIPAPIDKETILHDFLAKEKAQPSVGL